MTITGITINQNYLTRITELFGLTEKLYSIVIEGKNHILAVEPEVKKQADDFINKYIDEADAFLEKYSESLDSKKSIRLFNQLLDEYDRYKKINREIITLSEENKDYLALKLSSTAELACFRRIQHIINKIMQETLADANLRLEETIALKKATIQRIYVLVAIIIAIAFLIGYTVIKDITESIEALKENLKILGRGEIPKQKVAEFKDEIGEMAVVSNLLSDNLSYLGNFATQIKDGNYAYSFTPLSKKDILGNRLLNLRDNLLNAKNAEQQRRVEDTHRNWIAKGLEKFSEILRQNADNINVLSDTILRNCIDYIEANQGGIFSYNDNDKENIYLELLASYAFNRKKFISKRVNLGDGLVGTCALEKETIYLTEIPENYLEISSGLGRSKPKAILIVPLKIEDTILGVIEIAGFEDFEAHKIEFIERLAENIAVSLSTAKINARTIYLYEESKRQSEELARQEEEMRKNLEDMRITQEDAIRREIEMQGIISAVDNTLIKCEYDINGTLLSANAKYLHLMEYRLDKVQGKNVRMFIPDEKLEKFTQYWQNLCKGIPYQGIINRKTSSGEIRWLFISYTPVKNKDGEVFKILFLANDITEYIGKKEEAKRRVEKLETQQAELKKNYEKNARKLNQKVEKLKNIKEQYEYELKGVYASWKGNLKKAENLKTDMLKYKKEANEKNSIVEKSKKTIRKIQKELENTKSRKTTEAPAKIKPSEMDDLYKKWLDDLDKQ